MSPTMPRQEAKALRFVIGASSLGTLIEWYDFFIFATLTSVISTKFFPGSNGKALLDTLATFGIGFVFRPFGALAFGRIGDVVGRKYAFLVTLIMMGVSTACIGLLPTYAQAGWLAPAMLIGLRILQGLALGGEYGGAATYIAEHAPAHRRGYYTSYLQTTATLGFLLSLVVIIGLTAFMGKANVEAYGWRLPFLFSLVLIIVSVAIRLKMSESPVFQKAKAEGSTTKNPIRESFGNKENRNLVLIALLGATMGQGTVWYTGQFYALSFSTSTLKLPTPQIWITVAIALIVATPFFVVFGHLSDKIGRKNLIVGSCLASGFTYIPMYWLMMEASKPPVNWFIIGVLIWLQVMLVTIVYGPIAAFLVELFPTRIRYTSMSLPYHIGNGIFGGLTPFFATLITQRSGQPLMGLVWPICIALVCGVIGWMTLPDRTGVPLESI